METVKNSNLNTERLLRWPDVQKRVGLCRSHAHKLISEGLFPSPIKLTGARASAWIASEIDIWVADRIKARQSSKTTKNL